MTTYQLDSDFVQQYGISGYHQNSKSGGQKVVFFPIRNGEKSVLKIFNAGADARFDRELEIYNKFSPLGAVPKILEVATFKGATFVFEEFIEGSTLADVFDSFKGEPKLVKDLTAGL